MTEQNPIGRVIPEKGKTYKMVEKLITEPELRKRLTDQLVVVSGYPKYPEQVQGYIDDIITLIKEAGYVKLAEDQRLPSSGEVVLLDREPFESGYHLGQLRMIETGWRKMILEK